MAQTGSTRSMRARWVLPVSGPPLKDAAVTIADGRIVAVGNPPDGVPVEDLGNVALLPGLVNAHTHLEFSDLDGPIGRQGIGMTDWLRLAIEHRGMARTGGVSPVVQGLAESVRCGVTTIGEIAQPEFFTYLYRRTRCEGTLFLELIAPLRERVEMTLAAARRTCFAPSSSLPPGETQGVRAATLVYSSTLLLKWPRKVRSAISPYPDLLPEGEADVAWQHGLSPHAPYTVHPDLLAGAVELSAKYHAPLAMHLAESLEEIEFLRDGSGRFRELLESRRVYDAASRPRGSRPLDEMGVLSQAHRAMIVHGNYLDDEEIEFLGRHRDRMAVIYCPRTHAWFGHAPYPLEKMLAAGAVVALGTDSRASSPDLSVLAEMRHVARSFSKLSRATILELGTLGGARALGREAEIGTLAVGNWANLTAIRLPDDPRADPHELLIDGDGDVVGTWVRGRRCK